MSTPTLNRADQSNRADRSDDDLLAELDRLTNRTDGHLSRNAVMTELGIGAGRAARLLDRHRSQTRPGHLHAVPTQTGPAPEHPDHPDRSSPAAAHSDRSDTSPQATNGLRRSGTATDSTDHPAGTTPDTTSAEPTEPTGPVQHDPGPGHRTGQTDTSQTGPAQPGPAEIPGPPPNAAPSAQTGQANRASSISSLRTWLARNRALLIVAVIALPAAVAIWSGWVGLGAMAGFGTVNLLPGIAPLRIDTAITLPIGVEAYAALALHVWLTRTDRHSRAAIYARRSAFAALAVGAIGQVAYHLMASAGVTHAPTPITVLVAILPVAVLGMATSLVTIVRAEGNQQRECEPHASTERSSL